LFVLCIKLLILVMAANISLTPISRSLSVLSGYCLLLLTMALPITATKTPVEFKVKPSFFCLILLVIVIAASYVAESTALNLDLLKDVLLLICTYAAIAVDSQPLAKRDLQDIFNLGKVLCLTYVAYTFLPFDFRYTVINEWGDTAFTMSMGNTNATAISVMFCILLLMAEITQTDSVIKKCLNYVLALMLFYTVYLLGSRTVLVCCFGLVFYPVFHRMRIRKFYLFAAMMMPIVFIGLQIWLASVENIVVLGKPLASGRNEMFAEFLLELQTDPTGYFMGKWGKHRLANAHNAPFAILLNFGVLGLLLYYLFWTFELAEMMNQKVKGSIGSLALVGIMMYFIHSSAEAAPMLGSALYGAEMVIVCRLAKDSFK